MARITPKKWSDFQHYKDRNPPWIKLHKAILDDYEFQCLPDASRALAPCLWLLASEYQDGKIDASFDKICFRLRMTKEKFLEALKPLETGLFFTVEHDDSNTLAERKQGATLEKEKEKEKEKTPYSPPKGDGDRFDIFWKAYPRKIGKGAAKKAFDRLKPSKDLLDKMLEAVETAKKTDQWRKDNGQFIPHPATWLNQGRWEDEYIQGQQKGANDVRRPLSFTEQREQRQKARIEQLARDRAQRTGDDMGLGFSRSASGGTDGARRERAGETIVAVFSADPGEID